MFSHFVVVVEIVVVVLVLVIVLAPFVGVVVWYLVLSWHAKALSAGMALLGFKAWASKEANTALHMQSEKAYASVKRSARRVSMAASRGMGSIFSPIKEA